MSQPDFLKCECRHCAGHIEFPAEAGGQNVPCPHCGRTTVLKSAQKTQIKFLLATIAVVIVAIAAIFLLKKLTSTSSTSTAVLPVTNPPVALKVSDETITNDFAVSQFKLEKTPGSSLVYVIGTAHNLENQQRFSVKIIFDIFDTNHLAAGTASDYAPTIDPNGIWRFKALVISSKPAAAKLNSIRADQ